ncbi:MAG: PilZ domain-containing protein [Candidatus Omnitrophota bacterium]
MVEKRKYKRYSVSMKGNYKLLNWNEEFGTSSKDASKGGFGLIINEELKPGTPIEIELPPLDLGSQERIILKGVVVWSRELDASENKYVQGSGEGLPWKSAMTFYGQGLKASAQNYRVGIRLNTEISAEVMKKILTYIPTK